MDACVNFSFLFDVEVSANFTIEMKMAFDFITFEIHIKTIWYTNKSVFYLKFSFYKYSKLITALTMACVDIALSSEKKVEKNQISNMLELEYFEILNLLFSFPLQLVIYISVFNNICNAHMLFYSMPIT